MKGKSMRRFVAEARRRYAKRNPFKNGVLPAYWFDFPGRPLDVDVRRKKPRYPVRPCG